MFRTASKSSRDKESGSRKETCDMDECLDTPKHRLQPALDATPEKYHENTPKGI